MTHSIVKVDNYLFAIGDNYKYDVFPYLVIEKQTNGGYIVWQVDNLNDWDEKNQYQILTHLPLNGARYLDNVDVLPPTWRENGERGPKLPIGFECEMICGRCYSKDDECWSAKECTRGYDFKDIPKTITNSEGRTEWVGKWVY